MQKLPFKQEGIYLITGGLGGLGVEIAKYLLENYQAKLLLVGRSPLAKKIEIYQKLKQLGGEIIYEAVDICHLEQLQQIVAKTLSQWQGELDGVIHLAGVYQEDLLIKQTAKSLAAVLRSKVLGTWVLHQLLKNKPNSFFIHFSSLASFLGGAMIAAYSAANCFLESFAHYQRTQGHVRSYCFAWSIWEEKGISKGYNIKGLNHARGYYSIALEKGLNSWLAGLYHNQRQLLIGLDGSNPYLQQYLETEVYGLEKLTGYFTSKGDHNNLQNLRVSDRFGTKTTCTLVQLTETSLTETGEIDREQLLRLNSSGEAGQQVAPRNKLERELASLWQEVLGVRKLGVHDNFFELGGNSIKAMTTVNKLQEQLNQIFHPVALFESPTIDQFATYLQENYFQAIAHLLDTEASYTQKVKPKIGVGEIEQMQGFLNKYFSRESILLQTEEKKNPPAIFILSPPRSGSTLLRVILAGHPQLFAPPELYLLSFSNLRQQQAFCTGRTSFIREGTIRALMEIKDWDADRAEDYLNDLAKKNLTTKEFYGLMQQWLPGQRIVDKTPTYAFNLEILQSAEAEFENPVYLHLQRHPYGTISSMEEAKIDMLLPEQVDQEVPLSLRQKSELIWLLSHQNILKFLENIPPERQYSVQFEDMVQQSQATVEGLCQFLGLDFHPDMLQPYAQKKQRMTDGINSTYRMIGDPKFHTHQGINAKAAERWQDIYQEDFLSSESWQVAEFLGYKKLTYTSAKPSSPLVALQSQGTKTPFFFVHPIGGSIFSYGKLADHLGSEQPFYGLQSLGLNGEQEPLTSIESMATTYIEALQTIQPQGPYQLGGWSFGGTIAFEMAQQLVNSKQEVALLAMVDTYSPLIYSPVPLNQQGEAEEEQLVTVFAGNLLAVLGKEQLISWAQLQQMKAEEQWEFLIQSLSSELEKEQIYHLYQVFKANIQARNSYQLQPYVGKITFFGAGELLAGVDEDISQSWSKWAKGGMDIYRLAGNHYSIIKSEALAQSLQVHLR